MTKILILFVFSNGCPPYQKYNGIQYIYKKKVFLPEHCTPFSIYENCRYILGLILKLVVISSSVQYLQ